MPSHAEALGAEVVLICARRLPDATSSLCCGCSMSGFVGSPAVPSVREYFHCFGLDREKLALAKPDALVMHPGPINRGVEIDTDIADDIERSVILEQVETGVAVRQGRCWRYWRAA